SRAILRKNLTTIELGDDDAKALADELKNLGRSIEKLEKRVSELKAHEDSAAVPADVEAAADEISRRLTHGYPLLHGTPKEQREAIKALFGSRTLRNGPRAPAYGVHLRIESDKDSGKLVVWTAKCEFVHDVQSALSNAPEIAD